MVSVILSSTNHPMAPRIWVFVPQYHFIYSLSIPDKWSIIEPNQLLTSKFLLFSYNLILGFREKCQKQRLL